MERASILGDLFGELNKRGYRFHDVAAFKRRALDGKFRMRYTKGELSWESDPDWRIYFADVTGKPLSTEQLYFEPRPGAPLPDLVSLCSPRFRLRTRFYKAGDKFEHEIVVEPPAGASKAQAPN